MHFPNPWDPSRTSIHDHISAGELGEDLPDENGDGGMRWIAGGADGAVGHHFGAGGAADRAAMVHRALAVVVEDPNPTKIEKLYELLCAGSALEIVDPLLEKIARGGVDAAGLEALARWLATEAPDREPVKIAIALLGLVDSTDHLDLFTTFGSHEELTLYAAVALANVAPDPDRRLFELATRVHGWGRIQVVERLAGTDDPEIKAWMLRDGYRNQVMYEYLAYICATTGGLREALEAPAIDDALLRGAGDIIAALIAGGPAEDLSDYDDGAAAIAGYLDHLGERTDDVEHLLTVAAIAGALDDALGARARAMLEAPGWRPMVESALESGDGTRFARATYAASAIGLDPWPYGFARLEAGGDNWYMGARTDDRDRLARVVDLAERRLDLTAIASGPASELGLGPEWADHGALDFVLQELHGHPGLGWPLIRAGLASPVVRNRNMGVRALAGWPKERWPDEARAALERAHELEPDDELRERIGDLLI